MESPQIVLAIRVGMSALDAVDGSSTGTEVPWMWVLLRPPRFGGAKHASGHDNRSRYRQVCFSNMQPRVKEKAPRRRGPTQSRNGARDASPLRAFIADSFPISV